MRLSYLACFHHMIMLTAVLAALFLGMLIPYTIRQAEHRGMVAAYSTMSIKGLSEVGI